MNKFFVFTFVLFGLSTSQAGKYKSDNTLGIRCSKTVPKDQCKLLDKDLAILKTLHIDDSQQEVPRLFKTTASATNYEAWLADRVNYIVPEDFDFAKSITVLQNHYIYPNSIMPDIEIGKTTENAAPTKGPITVMSNIGSALYFAGKQSSSLIGVDLPGIGVVPANSPRIGLIKIGAGHFRPLLHKSGETNFDTQANSLNRLSTFFHEARHSDGNGKSLGFFHAICPEGHHLAGYNGCDRNLNGPYTIEATFLKTVVNNCEACSEPEKEALRNLYMDSYGRVLIATPTKPKDTSFDASIKESCDLLRKAGSTADLSFCDKYDNPAPSTTITTIPSVEFDDSPEFGSPL